MENKEGSTAVGPIRHCLSEVNRQWPYVKYTSLGFYSAWILLMMGSAGIAEPPSGLAAGHARVYLYLLSGVPLSVVLIACGLMWKRVEGPISSGPLVPVMSVIASIGTFFVCISAQFNPGTVLFAVGSVMTGIGTPFLCLRIGFMFSYLDSNRAFFLAFSTALLANLLYFMCVSIDWVSAIVLLSLLPTLSMLMACLKNEVPVPIDDSDVVPAALLPRGFFAHSALFVAVFSVAIGLSKGLFNLEVDESALMGSATAGILWSFIVVAVLLAVATIAGGFGRLDISRLHYPTIVVAALACMLAPLLDSDRLYLHSVLLNVSYNVFILTLWCYFCNLAGQTSVSSVRVFGIGRGLTAAGTTLGQLIALGLLQLAPSLPGMANWVAIGCTVAILVAAVGLFDERSVSVALEKTFREETVAIGPSEAEAGPVSVEEACRRVAQAHCLTARESEVMALLNRGRTASIIADDLCISYNTAKGYVKNVYAKCDVHSRQELIDLIEEMK